MIKLVNFVCGDCIDDDGIRGFISANAEVHRCSFCQAIGDEPIAAPLGEVGEYINRCLRQEYGDAVDELPRDSEEKEYFGSNWDSEEMLTDVVELEFPNDHNGVLLGELVGYLDDITWCERNGLGLTDLEGNCSGLGEASSWRQEVRVFKPWARQVRVFRLSMKQGRMQSWE